MTELINISSDLNFITGKLFSKDQKIEAFDIGLKVLEEKPANAIGHDVQLTNIDLQNSLQKQQPFRQC